LGISRSGGARNPHVFQYTLRFLRSGGTRPSFARDGFFTNSQALHADADTLLGGGGGSRGEDQEGLHGAKAERLHRLRNRTTA
ncbi:MAG: hypothetical protein ACREYE_09885, partial [Gammaproteobacteria bacterium]